MLNYRTKLHILPAERDDLFLVYNVILLHYFIYQEIYFYVKQME